MRKKLPWLIASVFLVSIVAISLAYLRHQPEKTVEVVSAPIPKTLYGINIDTLEVETKTVKPGENLSVILSSFLTPQQIDDLARNTRGVFDVRKVKPGNRYSFLVTTDSVPVALYFIYEVNPIDYVIYDLRDTIMAFTGKKEVKRIMRSASGTITTSMWNTFMERKLDVNLALALSEVYAWTVDFYGLQKGDRFKVIYDELSVDGALIGSDRIYAAVFSSEGKDHFAFYYDREGSKGYFSETGQSLRRSFLKAPLRFSRISSRFSRSRMHPILKIRRPHFGVDYAAPKGTPVVALGDGTVTQAGWKGGYGRFISIRHNSVYTSTYAHLSGYGPGISSGRHVMQGELIGYVGSSGLATGPHLDFRVYKNGSPVDPVKIESPATDPVKKEFLPSYDSLVLKLRAGLDTIPW